jgi:hypothetical protein
LRAVFVEEAFETDVRDCFGRHDVRGRALHHGDLVALFEVVLGNVVGRVAGADDDGFLAFAVFLGAWEVGGVAEAVSGEGLDAFHRGHVFLPTVAGCLDYMTGVEGTGFARAI